MRKKIAIMGSGNGSNFEAIVKYFDGKPVDILCISNKDDAKILERAERLKIKSIILNFAQNEEFFSAQKFDLVVLAGYMRVLTPKTLANNRFINIHPSLLPAFKGLNAIEQAYNLGVKVTGVSVHWVNNELDGGKIIAQYPVLVEPFMNLMDLEAQIHELEHLLYPAVIDAVLYERVFNFSELLKGSKRCNSSGCGSGCHKMSLSR